ncbi:MAG TPA: phosphoglucosamine mutase [Candidatus Acidoferrales bacterium]|nr:phosphoglucosamine mutase [Candidatus Acidoferrales bacterium]
MAVFRHVLNLIPSFGSHFRFFFKRMPKELFGTDGIRGLPGKYPLDDATLFRAGVALGQYIADHRDAAKSPRVLIGMDTRESGPEIASHIAQGLRVAGIEPVSVGIMTTPGVAWLVHTEDFSAGVVISASHNPYHDNGVKLVSGSGMKFPDAAEAQIEMRILAAQMDNSPIPEPVSSNLPATDALHVDYLSALRGKIFSGANLAGMKIVLDCANGAASALAPELFRGLGAQVQTIFDNPDGRNINDHCGSLHPGKMQEKTVTSGADLGVAFDGDADRAVFSTSSGRYVDGDAVLFVASRFMKKKKQLKGDTVVGTSMSNLGLERTLERDGLKLARVPVGDRYVLEEMLRIDANLGGEQSGHVIFLDDSTTGDGMLTAVKMASLVSIAGKLDTLLLDLKVFPQKIVNVRVRSKPPLESLPLVASALADGKKRLGDSGRIVVRYSGTERLARVMVEAERAEDVDRYAQSIASALQSSVGI